MRRSLAPLVLALALSACALTPQAAPAPTPAATAGATPAAERATPTDGTPAGPTGRPEPTGGAPTSDTAAPTAPAAGAAELEESLARIDQARGLPRDQEALAAVFRRADAAPEPTPSGPPRLRVGDTAEFNVSDQAANRQLKVSATLRYAGPVVLMYVDNAITVDQGDLERSAKQFEQQIYPRDRQLFGQERSPGVDGDPRITILNTEMGGSVVGYFSSADAVSRRANRFSNERDMFVIDATRLQPGSDSYASTLAHEFQHMIHWNEQRRSPTWFNEGMSTIAEDQNGFVTQGKASAYLAHTDLQLTGWAPSGSAFPHYGAANLFLRYFYEQYAQSEGLSALIEADAGNNLQVFADIAARKRPEIRSFADLVADWAVANRINDPSLDGGRYSYSLLPTKASSEQLERGERSGTVSQFGADYLDLPSGPASLQFQGATTVSLAGVEPASGRYAWWSNRGDDNVATLTRAFDLTQARDPVLQFSLWHELETGWDYGYITVSADGGSTWEVLKGSTSTASDPQGNNLGGQAFTGVSGAAPDTETDQGERGRWVEEQVDLSSYAGKQILLRFWVVNDDAYNASGLLLDNLRIPAIGYSDDAEQGDGGWQAEGFVRSTGDLPQRWQLRLIRTRGGGSSVEAVPVDAAGRASVQLAEGERGTLLVMGSTPHTSNPASYTYTLR